MACLSPSRIKNRRYAKMSKRELQEYSLSRFGNYAIRCTENIYEYGGKTRYSSVILPPDYYIEIPCGICFDCLKRKRNEWCVRLLYEIDAHKQNSFVTLTFDDEYLEKFKDDYKRPLKLYIDRLRKALGYRPRYWFIPEKGDEVKYSGRFHYHGIFFGTSREDMNFALMREQWMYGHSWIGYVNPKTASYCTKYLLKFQNDFKPFILCSNGIGKTYLKSRKDIENWHTNNYEPRMYIERYGRKYPMSQYYKRKIFGEENLFCLSLNRLTSFVKFEKKVKGVSYYSQDMYEIARNNYYLLTLKLGLSQPKKTF